jgi:hypothetical protein
MAVEGRQGQRNSLLRKVQQPCRISAKISQGPLAGGSSVKPKVAYEGSQASFSEPIATPEKQAKRTKDERRF